MNNKGVARAVTQNVRFAEWVGDQIDNLPVALDNRTCLAGAALSVSLSHHVAIAGLVRDAQTVSAFALLRPQMEAFLRGSWIAFAASDDELQRVMDSRSRLPDATKIVAQLEVKGPYEPQSLTAIFAKTWGTLCDFTHCGIHTLKRHLGPDGIGPNFCDGEIIEVLAASDGWAHLAVIGLAGLAGRDRLALSVLEHATMQQNREDSAE